MTPDTQPPPCLMCRDLEVTYGGAGRALRGISFSIQHGERVAMLGESGCGKTTLARSILGLLPPSATVTGSICLDGSTDLVGAPERVLREVRGTRVGYVPQNPSRAFDPLHSVGSQIAEAWRCHGQRVDPNYVSGVLEQFGVADAAKLARQRPSAWSGGMLQRAAILAATALRPGLVVADEPTSALDRLLARQMLMTLAANCTTSLVITHDIDLIAGLVDRVIVLYAGRIVQDTKAGDFFRGARHPYARSLLQALPRPGRLPEELPGDPPLATATITGCAFAPRCAQRSEVCALEPALVDGVACHLAGWVSR